jgi:hypothetical protein
MDAHRPVDDPDQGGRHVNRVALTAWKLLSSRIVPPVVIGLFLVLYIGIAFFTDETLITLMALTRRSVFLAALLSLLPLNGACRIVVEAGRFLKRRRAMNGTGDVPSALFDETTELAGAPPVAELEGRLRDAGYRTRWSGDRLAAWRGVSLFPVRFIFLAGTVCLFAGILISLTTRTVYRYPVIEGEPLPGPVEQGGIVEHIRFENASGPILSRDLSIEVASSAAGEGGRTFGLYPPSQFRGAFVYPRYLGVALHLRFSAPDLPAGYAAREVLNLYPPGREAAAAIPGTPYRLNVTLEKPGDGTDPYTTGRMNFQFKILNGNDVLYRDSMPSGGEFARDGYRLAFPDARRMVLTDYIGDRGIYLVAASSLLYLCAVLLFAPIRAMTPRREMLFVAGVDRVLACSRAEGRARRHNGVFHDALDVLETGRTGERSSG